MKENYYICNFIYSEMTIISSPLSNDEKRMFKKLFISRIVLGILLLPLFGFFIYTYISDFSFYNFDELQLFGLLLLAAMIFLVFKYVIPGYIYTYKSVKAKNKLIQSTIVLDFKETYNYRIGIRFIISTEYRIIDSWRITLLNNNPPFPFSQLYIGMPIKIHYLEHNKTDIIKIEKI
jgi:hypothetical protein